MPSNNNYVSGKSIIPCKPNDKIVIEYAVQFRAAWIIWCEKDGSFISSQLLQNARKFDATAPANCYGFKFSISETNNTADIESTKHITITINDKYAVCVKAESPNIFNMNGRTAGSAASADIYEDTVKITTLTGSGNAPCVFFYLGPISKFLGKRLYIKADKMESSHSAEGKASCRMVLRAVNGNRSVQSFGIYQNTKAGTWMQSAEIPEDLDVSTVTDLCLQLYIGDGTAQVAVGETATFENVMVCEEKTDEYHPYQSNVTYIPVDYPLFEGDKIIRRNGEYKLVRKWGVQIDDGTHAWKKNSPSDNSDYMYYRNTEPDKDATKLIYCNRLKRVAYAEKSVGISLSSFYPKAIYVRLDADILPINDAGHFNQWLSDHPLTIVYPMETPTEEPLSPEAQKALHSIMATDEQTELTIVGVPADAGIQNQFLLPRNEDGALNTTAYCTAEKNKIVLNELVAQNLDARVNKLEIDNSSLAEQTIVVE